MFKNVKQKTLFHTTEFGMKLSMKNGYKNGQISDMQRNNVYKYGTINLWRDTRQIGKPMRSAFGGVQHIMHSRLNQLLAIKGLTILFFNTVLSFY